MTTPEALEMLAACFNEPLDTLTPQSRREDMPGWDSMGVVMLIAELDERFNLELSAERSRSMQQISEVLDFLREHGLLTD
jgi:acyl carrier protein